MTCGSAIQLEHVATRFRLTSQEVQYGTGSGQQSVTLHRETDKASALWKVLAADGKQCKRGYAQAAAARAAHREGGRGKGSRVQPRRTETQGVRPL